MKYLAEESVRWAITRLQQGAHPFLGITFLACKAAGLPIGETRNISLDSITKGHLNRHHRLAPQSRYYFQPFSSRQFWVTEKYPSSGLQAINTQTFRSIFIHPKGSRRWGLVTDYVRQIVEVVNGLTGDGYPNLLAIAIWLQKHRGWEDHITLESVLSQFLERLPYNRS